MIASSYVKAKSSHYSLSNLIKSSALFLLTVALVDPFHGIARAATTFKEISALAGVKVSEWTWGSPISGDFDHDGNEDAFVVNHNHTPKLFRNNGNGIFTDVRAAAGITASGDRHGAAWGDYNNDGNLDLFITIGANHGSAIGKKLDQLYRNNGDGTFTDVTVPSEVGNINGRGRSVNWIDFNNDGLLDLFIKNYNTANVLYRNNGYGTFKVEMGLSQM